MATQHLRRAGLPYIVRFEFLSKGIKIRKDWYPILKMEWIQAELLHEYIKKHLQDPAALLKLAERWQVMINALKGANIGHGDLQHGNVLVVKNDFRLIDYDGMFVPSLTGRSSHEVGHRNYQHPLRTQSDFGPYLDNFAAWVVYVSLVGLSIDRSLWRQVGAGDEFILFRKEDFEEPDSSSNTFALLTKHSDPRIQSLATLFRPLLYLTPRQIPGLDGQSSFYSATTARTLPPSIDWLSDHVQLAPSSKFSTTTPDHVRDLSANASIPLPSGDSTWVLDFISPPATTSLASFSTLIAVPRIAILVSASSAVVAALICYFTTKVSASSVGALLLAAIFINRWVLLYFYRKEPFVTELEDVVAQEEQENHALNDLARELKSGQSRKKALLTEESNKRAPLTKQLSDLQARDLAERNRIDGRLKSETNSVNSRRLILNREEVDVLRRAQEPLQYEIARINRQITALVQVESDEVSRTLKVKQAKFLSDYLSKYLIQNASISGVGSKLKARLRASAIYTAADVQYWKVTSVDGIGSSKGVALVAWRDSLIAPVRTQIPTALNQSEINSVGLKYANQRHELEKQRDDVQRRQRSEEKRIRDQYKIKGGALDAEQSAAQNKAAKELQLVASLYSQESAAVSHQLAQLAGEVQRGSQRIDDEVAALQKQMFDCHWQLAKTRRELKKFENARFRNYVRFVLLGRHARAASAD